MRQGGFPAAARVLLGGFLAVVLISPAASAESRRRSSDDEGRPDVWADVTPDRRTNPFRRWLEYENVPAAERTIGRIQIPRVGISARILSGVGDATLRLAVGHFPETSAPGEDGNIALAAHRGTDFWGLRKVKLGDRIRITTKTGTYSYVVEKTFVIEPTELWVLDRTGDPTLTLITCYPFDYKGTAPQRFVVRARPV